MKESLYVKFQVVTIGLSFLLVKMVEHLVREAVGKASLVDMEKIGDENKIYTLLNPEFVVFSLGAVRLEMENKIGEITRAFPHGLLICVTDHLLHEEVGVQLIKCGVPIIISDINNENEYQSVVYALRNHGRYTTRELDSAYFRQLRSNKRAQENKLSNMEKKVLVSRVRGETMKETAYKLHIKEGTVSKYRMRLKTKIGATSDIDVLNYAILYNYVDGDRINKGISDVS